MRTVTINDSYSSVPSGTTGSTNITTSSGYPLSNGYSDSSSTSYARLSLSSNTTGSIYYTFNSPTIPSDATITSVECTAKIRVNNTTRVTETSCQLYSGTTAKGSDSSFDNTSSSNTVSLTTGTWTRQEVNSIRLHISGHGSSASQSKYIYFYGASLTINYSYNEVRYSVSVTVNGDATASVSKSEVTEGETATVTINPTDGETPPNSVTDNGVDVTSSIVKESNGSTGNVSTTASSETHSSLNSYNSSYVENCLGHTAENPSTSTNNVYSSGSGTTGVVNYSFDLSGIPANAEIDTVSCIVNGHAESSTMSSDRFCKVRLYAGASAKGSETQFDSTSNKNYTMSCGTWSRSEINSLVLRMSVGYYGGLLCGITLTVVYTIPGNGYVYKYTITSISSDRTIVVNYVSVSGGIMVKLSGVWSSGTIKVKAGGVWKNATKVFVKTGGTWVEV